ncbi:unnamed protein product, partial [Ascophyllum nodosum]
MRISWGTWMDVLRGGLSWPGVVILWTGLWTFLDRHAPGGTGVWKEVALALAGAVVMIWTRTLFSNAGMDSLDYEGTLVEMGSLLAQGRLDWRNKAAFFARSVLAMAGAILFWDGVFTLCDQYVWENTLAYNLCCATVGGAGMLWAMTSEDAERETMDDGIDCPLRPVGVRVARAGNLEGAKLTVTRLSQERRVMLYAKAIFCNVCSVIFWKGVEEVIERVGPDTGWTGVVFFVVGIVVLWLTQRLSLNSGLEDDREFSVVNGASEPAVDVIRTEQMPPFASYPFFGHRARSTFVAYFKQVVLNMHYKCAGSNKALDTTAFGDRDIRDTESEAGETVRRLGYCCPDAFFWPCALGMVDVQSENCSRWVMTAAELTGVVFAWTGIEWYVWDGDYIKDTWLRDVAYIGAGLTILIATGTFANLAGTISPMSILKQARE